MKSLLIILLSLSCNLALAQSLKTVQCKPEKATVYFSGAQIYYSENVNIPVGTSDFAFQGVSPYTDPATIITSGKGDFTILDAQFNTRYPESIEVKPDNPLLIKYKKEIKFKQDSIDELYYQLELIRANKEALVIEKGFLQNNPIIKGTAKKDSLTLVKDALDYYRQRQANIDNEWIKLTRQQDKLTFIKTQLTSGIDELNNMISMVNNGVTDGTAKPVYEILVTVFADVATAASIQFNYYTANASWSPEYDLKATSTDKSLLLVQKAKLVQNTAIDWSNVKLTLSTGNPSLRNVKPTLSPLFVQLVNYQQLEISTISANEKNADEYSTNKGSVNWDDAKLPQFDAKNSSYYTTIQTNMVQVEYSISLSYSIPADGKPHTIVIQKKELNALYAYYCVPKLDKDAFLQARIVDWEDMNLVYGVAKIYFDNSYVGKSNINPTEMDDTLNIDLGRDKTILVERKLIKEKSKTGFVDGMKTVTRSYTFTIRNTKANDINFVLLDQIPLSNQKDVTVTADEINGADLEEQTGMLTWNLKLKSKETKIIKLTYTVKHPGGMQINPLI